MVNYSRALPVDSSKVQNHHRLIHPFDVQIHFVLEEKNSIRSVSIVQSTLQIDQITSWEKNLTKQSKLSLNFKRWRWEWMLSNICQWKCLLHPEESWSKGHLLAPLNFNSSRFPSPTTWVLQSVIHEDEKQRPSKTYRKLRTWNISRPIPPHF